MSDDPIDNWVPADVDPAQWVVDLSAQTQARIQSDRGNVLLPDSVVRTNNGIQCDMMIGPCACGAWHNPDNFRAMQIANGASDTPAPEGATS